MQEPQNHELWKSCAPAALAAGRGLQCRNVKVLTLRDCRTADLLQTAASPLCLPVHVQAELPLPLLCPLHGTFTL